MYILRSFILKVVFAGIVVIICILFFNNVNADNNYANRKKVYKFSDNSNRNVTAVILNDSVIELNNRTNIAHNHYLFNFKIVYKYEKAGFSSIVISKIISSNKSLSKGLYLKPFDFRPFTTDSVTSKYIFPDLLNDTLRFSKDHKRLQIKDFCFELYK